MSGKPKSQQKMDEQDPRERIKNFDEVPYGYTLEQAMAEASRCLQCKKPACVAGCPVEIDIPGFIKLIAEGKFKESIRKLKEQSNLPAICGRVCPQEEQCEKLCILGKKFDPIAIGNLERFIADWERHEGELSIPEMKPSTGRRVAIVGSGPAGLTAAADLAKMGHDVTIFEAFHKAGGVLVYGIPQFRLPKEIVQAEVDVLKKMGVKIEHNIIIGKTITIDELLNEEGFEAVFIGTGAGLPRFLDMPGENLIGVYSANEYLTRVNLMKAYRDDYDTPILKGKNVAVFGGGNVAMDCARTALRLKSENVYIMYRRSRNEMPARREEIRHAEEEGIHFMLLTNPTRFIGDDDGKVKAVECLKMELGEPDASGRRRPIPIEGSEFVTDIDLAVIAIGNAPNPLVPKTTEGLAVGRKGNIIAEETTGATSLEGIFAGGDIVSGAATVIEAMGAGKRAARAIDEYLKSKK